MNELSITLSLDECVERLKELTDALHFISEAVCQEAGADAGNALFCIQRGLWSVTKDLKAVRDYNRTEKREHLD